MARLGPVFLAFLANWYGLSIFKCKPAPCLVCARKITKRIFALTSYFVVLDSELYPRGYRSVHWFVRSAIEFIMALFLMETMLSDFWYPIETSLIWLLTVIIKLLKAHSPKTGSLGKACVVLFDIVTHRQTPMVLSIAICTSFLCVALHGTRTIDFGIITRCGVKDFAEHVYYKVNKGIRKLKKSFMLKNDRFDSC